MALRLATGPKLNHLTRLLAPTTQIVMTPSAAAGFGATRTGDDRASLPAKYGSAADDSTLAIDLDLWGATGSFESAEDAAAWSILGLGSLASNTGAAAVGSASGLLSPDGGAGASTAIGYKDVDARPGEELTIEGSTEVDSATDLAVRVRNRQTGYWLKSDGTWDASQQDVVTNVGGWASFSKTFTMQDLDTCKADLVTLRTYLYTNAGTSRFDAMALYPSVNLASVHGHNIPPAIVPTLQRSADGSSWSTEVAMTLKRDTFASALSSLKVYRYWRLLFDGQPDTGTQLYVGEFVLAQYWELARNPNYDGAVTWTDNQTRQHSAIGDEFVHWHGLAPQRKLHFDFAFTLEAEYLEFHKRVFRASRGGGYPIWLNLTDLDSEIVILGRIGSAIVIQKSTPRMWSSSLEVLELALPSDTAVVAAYDAPVEGSD